MLANKSAWDIFNVMLIELCNVNSNYSVLFYSYSSSEEEGQERASKELHKIILYATEG